MTSNLGLTSMGRHISTGRRKSTEGRHNSTEENPMTGRHRKRTRRGPVALALTTGVAVLGMSLSAAGTATAADPGPVESQSVDGPGEQNSDADAGQMDGSPADQLAPDESLSNQAPPADNPPPAADAPAPPPVQEQGPQPQQPPADNPPPAADAPAPPPAQDQAPPAEDPQPEPHSPGGYQDGSPPVEPGTSPDGAQETGQDPSTAESDPGDAATGVGIEPNDQDRPYHSSPSPTQSMITLDDHGIDDGMLDTTPWDGDPHMLDTTSWDHDPGMAVPELNHDGMYEVPPSPEQPSSPKPHDDDEWLRKLHQAIVDAPLPPKKTPIPITIAKKVLEHATDPEVNRRVGEDIQNGATPGYPGSWPAIRSTDKDKEKEREKKQKEKEQGK
ncbi:hypothetical protein [Streptomyces sp. NPDC058045]|uniref:hypothetical protein n=1 Tax=Streptomyces sp. NPDC058045 TaxID=3346311 RepID=UPI0036E829C8